MSHPLEFSLTLPLLYLLYATYQQDMLFIPSHRLIVAHRRVNFNSGNLETV